MALVLVRLDVLDDVLGVGDLVVELVQLDQRVVVLLTEQRDFAVHSVDLPEQHIGLRASVGQVRTPPPGACEVTT